MHKIIPNKYETIEMELPIEKSKSQENLKSVTENLTDNYEEIIQKLKEVPSIMKYGLIQPVVGWDLVLT